MRLASHASDTCSEPSQYCIQHCTRQAGGMCRAQTTTPPGTNERCVRAASAVEWCISTRVQSKVRSGWLALTHALASAVITLELSTLLFVGYFTI